jgi:predicted PurR-regulated permease PerM
VSFATLGRIVCAHGMELLRNLFGNLTSGIIRLLVAVGILAAVYFFIVKPVLHTTDNAINSANKTFEKSFGTEVNLGNIDKTIEDVNHRVQREIKKSFRQSQQHGHANKLIHCIQRAHQDVTKIQHCTDRYQ